MTQKPMTNFWSVFPKGKKDEIQAHAASLEESLNGYTVKAIEERMEREKGQ